MDHATDTAKFEVRREQLKGNARARWGKLPCDLCNLEAGSRKRHARRLLEFNGKCTKVVVPEIDLCISKH